MCRTGCPSQDHESWGACLRAASINIGDIKPFSKQRSWDRELGAYADAKRQGVQPAGTNMPAIKAAMESSEKTGVAFNASAGA